MNIIKKIIIILNISALLISANLSLYASEDKGIDPTKKREKYHKQHIEHNKYAKGAAATRCSDAHSSRKERLENKEKFHREFVNQKLDKIKQLREDLSSQTDNLKEKEKGYNVNAQTSINTQVDEDKIEKYRKELEQAEIAKKNAYKKLVIERQKRNPLLNGGAYTSDDSAYQKALSDYNTAVARVEYLKNKLGLTESSLLNQRPNLVSSGNNIQSNDKKIEGSHKVSGCRDKDCSNLSGPLYERERELTNLYDQTTKSIKAMASTLTERANLLALEKKYDNQYKLYSLALEDVKDNSMAHSDLEMIALTSSAINDLKCKPHPLSEVESKAYHLFRSASATFLIAQINDITHYKESTDCIVNEEFTDDDKDKQMTTVERAANLRQQIFENLCLRVNSDDKNIKNSCKNPTEQMLGKDSDKQPKTREHAMKMFRAAYQAAEEELAVKRQKVNTANANVKKGEKWIKKDIKSIAASIALQMMGKKLGKLFMTKFKASCSRKCKHPLLQKAIKWFKFARKYYLYELWLVADLLKARAFKAKWEKKLEQAQHYSHMICNYKEAVNQEKDMANLAKETRDKAKTELEALRQKVQNEYNKAKKEIKNKKTLSININKIIQSIKNIIIPKVIASSFDENDKNNINSKIEQNRVLYTSNNKEVTAIEDQIKELKEQLDVELARTNSDKTKIIKLRSQITQLEKKKEQLIPNENIDKSAGVKANEIDRQLNPRKKVDAIGDLNENMAGGLGINRGSASFEFFLIMKNTAWKEQAYDPSDSIAEKESHKVVIKSVPGVEFSNDFYPDNPEKKSGFPLPETRVNYLKQIALHRAQHNIKLTQNALKTAGHYRDIYFRLVKDMKKRMKLGIKGLDEAILAKKKVKYKNACIDSNNQIDKDCYCKESNSCSKFYYPKSSLSLTPEEKNVLKYSSHLASGKAIPSTGNYKIDGSKSSKKGSNRFFKKRVFKIDNKYSNKKISNTKSDTLILDNDNIAKTIHKTFHKNSVNSYRNIHPELYQKDKNYLESISNTEIDNNKNLSKIPYLSKAKIKSKISEKNKKKKKELLNKEDLFSELLDGEDIKKTIKDKKDIEEKYTEKYKKLYRRASSDNQELLGRDDSIFMSISNKYKNIFIKKPHR